MADDVVVYTPERASDLRSTFREVWRFRGFVAYQTRRELRTEYTRSVLGWSWAVINPLTTLAIYSLVFGTILDSGRNLPPNPDGLDSFPHYLFSALVVWSVFNQGSVQVMSSFNSTINLRKRLYFPPACPAISRILALLVNNAVEIGVLFVAYLVVWSIGWSFIQILLLPPLMALFAMGVGLLIAVANSRYRDVGYFYQVGLRLLFFVTPIIYSLEAAPETLGGIPLRRIIELSPLTMFVTAARRCTYEQRWIEADTWAKLIVSSVGMFLIGWIVFNRHADDAAEGT